jgi:two-component system phosphate regulon sensor histidine kinase PhoR
VSEARCTTAALVNAIPEPASLVTLNGMAPVCNDAWRRSLNGMSAAVSELLSLRLRSVDAGQEPPQTIPLDESGARYLQISAVGGTTDCYLVVLRDETEIRRVEQMRKDFIANVSHELRTPLTAVRGYVETLMDPQFLTPDRVREFLPIIFEHTERLHNLMLDLLSLSRLESPDTRIELSSLSLLDELRDAVAAVAPLAELKGVRIEVRDPGHDVRVIANAEHLERVLVNLLDNAIKYGGSHKRVDVWTEVRDGFAWAHVCDEGQGIAPDEASRIFERFYRSRDARATGRRGSGLGLAIVKHIIQQLDGEVGVQSTVGRGSDFYFSLKLAEG